MQQRPPNLNGNPVNSIVGVVLMIVFLIGMFYVAQFVFRILYFLAPFMLIATLIINYRVVTGYLQWILALVKRNPVMGIGAGILTVLGFPIVSAFLLAKAIMLKKVDQAQEKARIRREGELIDYEEVDSEELVPPIQYEEKRRRE
ncbi:MAG: hypothetical protein HUU34_15190 [Saprospiraceae bacterium]|jgi:hypothetical protein|nr:hypothetical protein [Saprospiraceae bacterium]